MADHEDNIIYLEHDAEITEAIEKLKKAAGDEVRIVVPARSPFLQSIVNLKLLKKAAKSSDKELVLVTADKHATALAGKVGLLVAKNVKAEAKVPEADPEPKSVTQAAIVPPIARDEPRNDDVPVQRFDEPQTARKKSKKSKKNSRGKIPNYDRFKVWIWAGAGLLGFLLFMWLMSSFVQTATVRVQAAADRRDVSTTFVVTSTGSGDVPARALETTKDLSQSIESTGQKDVGAKATGTLSISNCSESDDFTLPAGSVVSTAGKKFTTTTSTAVTGAKFSGGSCSKAGTGSAAVTAAENGDSYNFSNATFTVGSYAKVTATGTTSGGVSKVIKVISQADLDGAVKALVDGSKPQALNELREKATEEQKVLDETLTATVVTQSSNPPVGAEATNATVTVKAKYSVLVVDRADLEKVVTKSLADSLKNGSQVLDPGLDQATYKLIKNTNGTFTYSLTTVAYIGQPIDKEALAKQVAGKPKKDVSDIAKQYPNVSGATVDAWPLVPNMPVPPQNIKVEISVSK